MAITEREAEHINITPTIFQDEFLRSLDRFPAIIGGIGTGKTFFFLLKIKNFCEENPGSRALIVRKEFTDLRDSTIVDFTRYFGLVLDSNKNCVLPNGSLIMFRHGDELNVLKNITLDIVGIEQAEEFPDDTQFVYLRDRLRGKAGPVIGQTKNKWGQKVDVHLQQLIVIANACGHNWLWNMFINSAQEVRKLSSDTSHAYTRKETVDLNGGKVEIGYFCATGTMFDNEENLETMFVADHIAMAKDSPNHYEQMVMNNFDILEGSDLLLLHETVYKSPNLDEPKQGSFARILGVDVARSGEDEIVFSIIEARSLFFWVQVAQIVIPKIPEETRRLTETASKIYDMNLKMSFDAIVVDDIGVGGGVTDMLVSWNFPVVAFNSSESAKKKETYLNKRTEEYFRLQKMLQDGSIKILDDEILKNQLMAIKYGYSGSKDQKFIWSKERMRKDGLKSPDRADALMMACSAVDDAFDMRNGNKEGVQKYGVGDEEHRTSTGLGGERVQTEGVVD